MEMDGKERLRNALASRALPLIEDAIAILINENPQEFCIEELCERGGWPGNYVDTGAMVVEYDDEENTATISIVVSFDELTSAACRDSPDSNDASGTLTIEVDRSTGDYSVEIDRDARFNAENY